MSNSNSADLAIILTQDGEEVQIPEHFIAQFPSIDAYLVCNKDNEKGTGKKIFKIPTNAPIVNKFHLDLILEYLELQRFYDTPASLKGKLPGFFAKYSSEQLKDAANVASFLGVTSLVNAIGEHFVSEIMKMEVSEMGGFFGEDFDEESRDRLIKWEQAVKLAKEKQAKLDEEKQAKLDAEAKARKEEEEKRELEEAKLRDELDEQEQDENDVNDENNEW